MAASSAAPGIETERPVHHPKNCNRTWAIDGRQHPPVRRGGNRRHRSVGLALRDQGHEQCSGASVLLSWAISKSTPARASRTHWALYTTLARYRDRCVFVDMVLPSGRPRLAESTVGVNPRATSGAGVALGVTTPQPESFLSIASALEYACSPPSCAGQGAPDLDHELGNSIGLIEAIAERRPVWH
jgi:hypothetical protein